MLRIEVIVYEDVKKMTRDHYGKPMESPECEKIAHFTASAINSERLVLTTSKALCAALDIDMPERTV